MRLTSSMRARLRSVVRPRLSRAAQSSATAAFLRRLDVDRAGELLAADDAQVLGAGVAERDELGVEGVADLGEHVEAEVLLALLDAGNGALGGPQQLCEVRLGHPLVASRVADESADPGQVGLRHGSRLTHI